MKNKRGCSSLSKRRGESNQIQLPLPKPLTVSLHLSGRKVAKRWREAKCITVTAISLHDRKYQEHRTNISHTPLVQGGFLRRKLVVRSDCKRLAISAVWETLLPRSTACYYFKPTITYLNTISSVIQNYILQWWKRKPWSHLNILYDLEYTLPRVILTHIWWLFCPS